MLKSLVNKFEAWNTVRKLEQIPLVKAGREAIAYYWLNDKDASGHFSQEFRQKQAEDVMEHIVKMALGPDPKAANREALAANVFEASRYHVLYIQPPPAPDWSKMIGKHGISGLLRARLGEIAEKDEDLRKDLHGFDAKSPDELFAYIETRHRIHTMRMNVFHLLRVTLLDSNLVIEKDWFRPFFEAMCGWREHLYRMLLDMPSNLATEKDPSGHITALVLSGWQECVLSGAQYPDLEWAERAKKVLKD